MKILFPVILFSVVFINSFPSFCQKNSLYVYGNDSGDTKAMVVEQNKSFYLIGSNGVVDQDVLLAKLNDHDLVWSKLYNNGGNEVGYGLYVDAEENHYLSGTGNSSSSTLFLKSNSIGIPVDSKKIGSFHDRIRFIHPLKDGNLLFYGELEGEISGNNQIALFKTDKDLNPIWKKIISHYNSTDDTGGLEMYSRKILELGDGSIILLTSLTDFNSPQSDRRIRLIKLNSDGSLNWVRGYSHLKADNPQTISLDYDDGFIICGVSSSYSQNGTNDIQLLKVDKDGIVEWSKVYGGQANDAGYHIIKTSDKEYLVGGVTESFGKGNNDLILMKIGQGGEPRWSKTFLLEILDFSSLNKACFEDITLKVQVKDVKVTNSSHNYSLSSFNNPYDITLDVKEKCLACYQDQQIELELCREEEIVLDVSDEEATAYSWENGYSGASRVVSSTGTYSVKVDYAFCSVEKRYTGNSMGFSSVNLGTDVAACSGETIRLKPKEDLPSGSFRWSTGALTNEIMVRSSGRYWLLYDTECGLVSDAVVVEFGSQPKIELGADMVLCMGEAALLIGEAAGGAIQWFDGIDLNAKEIKAPGKYWATVENNCGIASDTIHVSYKLVESPFFPNVITPNDDGINDNFVIDERLLGASLKVLNRWGKEVYYSSAYDKSWKGGDLPGGTYFITVFDSCTGFNYKGNLAVIRE